MCRCVYLGMIVIDNEMKSDFFVREIRTEKYAQEIFKEFVQKENELQFDRFLKNCTGHLCFKTMI